MAHGSHRSGSMLLAWVLILCVLSVVCSAVSPADVVQPDFASLQKHSWQCHIQSRTPRHVRGPSFDLSILPSDAENWYLNAAEKHISSFQPRIPVKDIATDDARALLPASWHSESEFTRT